MLSFAPKTVDSVLASFNKNLADLEVITNTQTDNSEQLLAQAKELERKAAEAKTEAVRAAGVAAKIRALIE